ncbi:olfactomedin-4-like [Seriola lalandi dorsalis]|uniref:Olfactomedin-4-like n=1 Tax=Seriola lalandi dorsalis TaxID=1841481 RepID=A0A3B4YHQ1_SERLL|nr:olfactomedin-4-like [Seriola lalandi dorsalis]
MPLTLLLLFPMLSPALAWLPVEDWESGNVTTSGGGLECVCSVFLPDSSFPANRVQHMQQVTTDLRLEVQIQINKLVHYEGKLDIFLAELKDLTVRVAMLESSPDSYIKLDFELLRIELREFEALVSQLKDSLNSSSPMLDGLYTEIHNMTIIVNQLETFDKNNLEVSRIEFAKLQRKLEECQKEQEWIKPDIGNCNHTGIVSVSKPTVIQLNAHLNPGYQYGGWGKDSKPVRGHESVHWYGAYSRPSVYEFYLYSNYDKLIQRSSFTHHGLPQGYEGTGNNYVVHGNTIYYQAANPFRMSKLNLTSSVYSHRQITKASERFTYTYSPNQYLDFSADEKGLWVMYATEEAMGKIVIAKIDEKSFGIEDEWTTSAFKPLAGNAFMVCGVMYAARPGALNTEEIYYSYDTKTREEKHMSIPLQKFQERFVNLHYNPTDQRLYMYNDGYYVSYNVRFNRK